MESKHTPGPWFYDSGTIWSESQLDPENKPYVFRGEEALAAIMSRNAQDARLIAAAPQMLEALEKIAEIGRQKGDARPQDAVSCFVIAEAAIAAAKGKV